MAGRRYPLPWTVEEMPWLSHLDRVPVGVNSLFGLGSEIRGA